MRQEVAGIELSSLPKVHMTSSPPLTSSMNASATDTAVPRKSAPDYVKLLDEPPGSSIPYIFDVRLGFNLEWNRSQSCLGEKSGKLPKAGQVNKL